MLGLRVAGWFAMAASVDAATASDSTRHAHVGNGRASMMRSVSVDSAGESHIIAAHTPERNRGDDDDYGAPDPGTESLTEDRDYDILTVMNESELQDYYAQFTDRESANLQESESKLGESNYSFSELIQAKDLPPECVSATPIDKQGERGMSSSMGKNVQCDTSLDGSWYYYDGHQLAEDTPGVWHCGTHAPGYLSAPNPENIGERRDVKVCFHWAGNPCKWSNSIQVINCGKKFVYKLNKPPVCHLMYCFEEEKPIHCKWGDYKEWSDCDKTCGGGKKKRKRDKIPGNGKGNDCSGSEEEEGKCNEEKCAIAKGSARRYCVAPLLLAVGSIAAVLAGSAA